MDKYQKIVATAFILHEGKVLIVRRSPRETFLPGHYEMPGGKVDFGEHPKDGVAREVKEETNLDVKAAMPYYIYSYISDGGQRHTVEIIYLCKLEGTVDHLTLSEDHDDFKWIDEYEIEKYKITGEMGKAIEIGFNEFKLSRV